MAIPTTLFSSLYVHGVLEITYDVKIFDQPGRNQQGHVDRMQDTHNYRGPQHKSVDQHS